VGKQPAIIELNGQKYDAITGARITSAPAAAPQPRVVSDIIPHKAPIARHHTPSHNVHKKTDHSHTLMRSAVKKPGEHAVTTHHVAHAEVAEPPKAVEHVALKHSHHPQHSHAHEVARSPHVSRFGVNAHSTTHHSSEPPKHLDAAHKPQHHTVHHPKAIESNSPTAEDLIQRSLNSIKPDNKKTHRSRVKLRHRAAKRLNVSQRVINFAAGSAAVLLIGSFFAYQNIPNLAVRYAGVKAGISAKLPSYHPTAFTVNSDVQYSPGQVAVQYSSNTDDRSYTVTQKKTDWSASELESFMTAQSGKTPQSYSSGEKTIYIQSEGDKITASTVEDGVLKNVAGNASLNTDQVIKIVSSM